MVEEHLTGLDGRVTRLFSNRNRWTDGEMAKDQRGNRVHETSPLAICWCLAGAIKNLYRPISPIYLIVKEKVQELGFKGITGFNDIVGYEIVFNFCKENNL